MKIMKLSLSVLAFWIVGLSFAQDSTQVYPPKLDDQVKFKISGYATFTYVRPDAGVGSFVQSVFAPIFTWRPSDKLFFQSEIEYASEEGAYDGAFEVEFATLNYLVSKHITLYAGKFLGPLGTFQGRYHPAWINKSVSKPIGLGSKINGLKRLEAGAEAGAGIKGGAHLGSAKINYDFYIANGGILDGTNGMLEMESLGDNNQNKAIGGRIGLLPLASSALEIGISGYTAKVGDKGSIYENTKVSILAVDLNYVKSTSVGIFDIKGEFQQRTVDSGTRYYTDATDTAGFTFDNNPSVFYAQLAYRLPSLEGAGWTNRLEFVGRYASMTVGKGATYGADVTDITLGLNYWVNFNTVLKVGYDIPNYSGAISNTNMLTIQAAMGF